MAAEVAVVGGAGVVGATVSYELATAGVGVTLVDVDERAADAHAVDVRHALAHAAHAVGRPERLPESGVRAAPPGSASVESADCVVMTASAPRPEAGAQRGGRARFLRANREVAADVAAWLGRVDPRPVVVVSNPLDRIAHHVWSALGWPRERVVGYSLSETARVADAIARLRDATPREVSCPVLGEHGEHIVPAFSRATVRGEPADLSADEREEVREYARDIPYRIMGWRGASETSRWVTGRGVALLVRRLLDGGVDDPVCLSTPLDGEYGYEDVCLSVPVTLSGEGVERIHEWDLPADERERLDDACRAIEADLEHSSR